MRLSNHFMKRRIADETILIPVGEMSLKFNGMITLNQTGEFVYQCLEEGMKESEIIREMLDTYQIEEQVARKEVSNFLMQCRELKIVLE